MKEDNMQYWNKVSKPPAQALKKIGGGRLSGMTDIKPQWRVKVMTEVYGLCGIGWKFIIKRLWTEPGSLEQVFAFAEVELFIKVDDKWSDGIPGNGGNMLVTKEKAGLHSSDEAFKMAITDALSTAMKMIGVASEIYEGNWDGSKYKKTNAVDSNRDPKSLITKSEYENLEKKLKGKGISHDTVITHFKQNDPDFNITDLTVLEYKEYTICLELIDGTK